MLGLAPGERTESREPSRMKIAVVGSGYVGLVLGACLAENGNDVTCIDKDASKVRRLRRGVMPIYEPGLEEIVKRNRAEKRLEFTTDLPRAVRAASIVFIAVGTPQHEDGSADLSHVLGVAREIAKSMNGYKVIVDKSTVPVGTAARVRELIGRHTSHSFSVVSNPEFLKQGAAVEDFLKPDRVVIGVEDDRARALMIELYAPFTRTGAPIMVMDLASAELCKYAANAILATRISFMNEIANVCEAFGADVDQVRKAIGADRRIGPSFLFPGIGFGGSCFPKDIKALIKFSGDKGYDFQTLKAVERVNDAQKIRFVSKLESHFGSLKEPDDRRLGPVVQAADRRHARSAGDSADPQAAARRARKCRRSIRRQSPWRSRFSASKITLADKSYNALKGADALVIATEWSEFREPDFARMRKLMKTPVIFDGRNIYSPDQMKAQGFTYYSVGR